MCTLWTLWTLFVDFLCLESWMLNINRYVYHNHPYVHCTLNTVHIKLWTESREWRAEITREKNGRDQKEGIIWIVFCWVVLWKCVSMELWFYLNDKCWGRVQLKKVDPHQGSLFHSWIVQHAYTIHNTHMYTMYTQNLPFFSPMITYTYCPAHIQKYTSVYETFSLSFSLSLSVSFSINISEEISNRENRKQAQRVQKV